MKEYIKPMPFKSKGTMLDVFPKGLIRKQHIHL